MMKLNTQQDWNWIKMSSEILTQKASVFNQLVQSGVDYKNAATQAGLTPEDIFELEFQNGVLNPVGKVGSAEQNSFAENPENVFPEVSTANQQQNLFEQMMGTSSEGDWRVRLSLAPGSTYLYNDFTGGGSTGILEPLFGTNGVIFPYTPQISTTYGANYSTYELTHSNFRGYFYQNSYVDEVTIQATFSAQDTAEANYMMAMIHFFRSASKMFYGQDANRGVPPPMLFLSGLGEYQFNQHPLLLRSFNYNLPNNVDYIRAYANSNNGNTVNTMGVAVSGLSNFSGDFSTMSRLGAAGLNFGASLIQNSTNVSKGGTSPTYVPTKLDITLSLLPIQTRQQISNQFSLQSYANGDLLKGGFW